MSGFKRMKISKSIVIKAKAKNVFYALVDLKNYNCWHPNTLAEGKVELGREIVLVVKVNNRTVKKTVLVTKINGDIALEWKAELINVFLLRRFLTVSHRFLIEELGENNIKLINEEEFSLLLSLLVFFFSSALKGRYRDANEGLKAYCEALDVQSNSDDYFGVCINE